MTELSENVQSLRNQLDLAVALLCRMTPWKTGADHARETVSIETPSGRLCWNFSKENAALFEALPFVECPAENCSNETNRERIMQVVSKMDLFNRQLHSSR